jgi:glutamyl-tRNA reductase
MNLLVLGCSYRTAPIALRERLAFDDAKIRKALAELYARYGCESVILSTCNRVELYLAKPGSEEPPKADLIGEFLGEFHGIPHDEFRPQLFEHTDADAVHHLFRVSASLDSLIVGEGQIAGQVRKAFETAQKATTTGPMLNTLFQHAIRAAKRARTETGICQGHVSVSSVAVDYVRQVFDHFGDKTILVIGAGKMGQLTLKHLRELKPKQILVTNRSPEKAIAVAAECHGKAIAWEALDDALAQADIVLSTTGAPEPIMPRRRWDAIRAKRAGTPAVILDIAVPRDFDPRIHDGENTFLFNIDDLKRIREDTIAKRQKHIAPAELIIEQERKKFVEDWASRRRNTPIIAQLSQHFESNRKEIVTDLLAKLNGKLSDADKAYIEGAFRLFQNRLLHAPIDALKEASKEGGSNMILQVVRKLFRLSE